MLATMRTRLVASVVGILVFLFAILLLIKLGLTVTG